VFLHLSHWRSRSPIVTANCAAKGSQVWMVPLGGGADFPNNWQIRAQVQFMFPEKR
jgi:hypothetical protein